MRDAEPWLERLLKRVNLGQGHRPPRGISRPCQDEQLVQFW